MVLVQETLKVLGDLLLQNASKNRCMSPVISDSFSIVTALIVLHLLLEAGLLGREGPAGEPKQVSLTPEHPPEGGA